MICHTEQGNEEKSPMKKEWKTPSIYSTTEI